MSILALAAEKLAVHHGCTISRETLRGWMIAARVWTDRRHRLPVQGQIGEHPHRPRPDRADKNDFRPEKVRNPDAAHLSSSSHHRVVSPFRG